MAVRLVETVLSLAAVNGAPLREGRVESLEPGRASTIARARCVVEGAMPDEQLELRLLIHLFDPTCSSRPARFASTDLQTDEDGCGSVDLDIRVEDVPATARAAAHGLRWEVALDGVSVYRTSCTSVKLGSRNAANAVGLTGA
jgi:hypothetical protein